MMFEPGAVQRSFGLEDYLRAARERWYVVLAITIATVALAGFLESQRTDQFTAEARVAVGPTPVGQVNANNLQRPVLEREVEVVASNPIADAAIAQADLGIERSDLIDDLDVQFRPDSEVLRIAYTDVDADLSAAAANAVASVYVEKRESEAATFYATQVDELTNQVEALDTERAALEARLDAIGAEQAEIVRLAELGDPGRATELAGERAVLSTALNSLLVEQRALTAPLRSAEQLLETRSPSAELLGDATVPGAPDGLARNIILIAATLAGFMLGLAVAFLRQRLDDTAKTDTQVELALGVKVLGSVPRFARFSVDGPKSLVMLGTGGSARMQSTREAFRRLATSIAFIGKAQEHTRILVTSYGPSEGKSTTTANLCIALAQAGKRVLLVSADLRRPSLEDRFGIELSPGLSEYLGRLAEAEVVPAPGVDNLWLLPAGAPPQNPGELLGGSDFAALLEQASESTDFVIIDTPPVGTTADANAAAKHVDGVLVVVDSSRTATADLLQVRADLDRSGAEIVGSVRNRTKPDRSFLRRNHYRYYTSSK